MVHITHCNCLCIFRYECLCIVHKVELCYYMYFHEDCVLHCSFQFFFFFIKLLHNKRQNADE